MKAEVLLRNLSRRSESRSDEAGRETVCVAMEMQEEQYSPSDFINQSYASRVDVMTCSPSQDLSPSSPVAMVTQSVIRPIPILPLDTSIYNTPPTYIDNLPPSLSVPIIPSVLLGNQVAKRDIVMETSISQSIHSQSSYSKSLTSSDRLNCSGVDLYDCRWLNCDQQFTCMDDLVVHVNDHHVRVERADSEYQCKWGGCPRRGKGFNARYKMLIHIRTHTNEKPHKCALCGKSFSRLENLKIHMRSHTGEKPYACPFEGCNKAYSNSSDRFKHVRTHQEDKPYICKMPDCNKRYTDPSSLRKHVRTHGHFVKENNSGSSHLGLNSSASPPHSSIIDIKRPINAQLASEANKSVVVPIPMLSGGSDILNNGVIHLSGLHSNPLLSSAIIPSEKQTISTQTEGLVSLTVQSIPDVSLANVDQKESVQNDSEKVPGQESPLDLSTSSRVTVYAMETDLVGSTSVVPTAKLDVLPQDLVRWEVIHMAS